MCGSTTPEFALEDDIKVLTILGIREAISNDNMNALSEYDRIKKMIEVSKSAIELIKVISKN